MVILGNYYLEQVCGVYTLRGGSLAVLAYVGDLQGICHHHFSHISQLFRIHPDRGLLANQVRRISLACQIEKYHSSLHSVILGQKIFGNRLNDIPLWLVSFTSLFFPVCFTVETINTKEDRKKLIGIQTRTFRAQSLASLFIYGVTLVAVAVLVYLPQDKVK